jgi:osmotically-inducible protein OsmY
MKKIIVAIVALFSTAVLQAHNGTDMQHQGAYGTSDRAATMTGETANASDQKIEKDVKYKISSGLFTKGFDQVKVAVRGGQVFLDGYVNSADEKAKLEKEVRGVDGVKSLVDNVQIQNQNALKADRGVDTQGTMRPMDHK